MMYVDVVLPLPVSGAFTYAVPTDQEKAVQIGMRVVVPFGSKKLYTGIVVLIHTQIPAVHNIKEIIALLDSHAVLRRPQYLFWEWISEYYMCTPGEVYHAAVPAGLQLKSETKVLVVPDFESGHVLSEIEQQFMDCLVDGKPSSIESIQRLTGSKYVMQVAKKLLDKGAVTLSESVVEKFKPKKAIYVSLAKEYANEEKLRSLFDELTKAPKQLACLMRYIELSKFLHARSPLEVLKKQMLVAGISQPVLSALIKKKVLEYYTKTVGRLEENDTMVLQKAMNLNTFQEKALLEIEKQFVDKSVVLLHGVTSSGKTELYVHMINKVLAAGRQVLYLVPEIALTTQLTTRLKRVFGNKLGIYHSRFSDAERVEIWNNVLRDKSYEIILGVRSSIFLPFRHLGLVIVDEEHEPSFKQYDPAPRYHARNAAIVLANMHGAKTLLGTATPSIESYFNAQTGKYGFVELHERHEEIQLPEIKVVDMKEAYRKKQHEGHFSDVLLEKITDALQKKEQVILFQNRRGYAPFVECKACAYVPTCKNCDVSLTYHASVNTLSCHYCGYTERLPDTCPVCKTPGLRTRGFGTEKIEEEIRKLYPDARVQRLDLDTTRSKYAYQRIIAAVENHQVDILIGTQMVTKGLDFQKVSLVGVLNADNLLNFPDFRAHERAFQLMAQVSGRAGRKHKRGLVVIQTSTPNHPVINQVLHHDYRAMYRLQTGERELFKYPPYYRMILITLKHRDATLISRAVREMKAEMNDVFGNRVLGPVTPAISRVQNLYIRQLLVKIETAASIRTAKSYLLDIMDRMLSNKDFKSVRISCDVDPN